MLVTCVGSASISGNISKVLTDTEKDDTVLQEKLNDMAALVAKMGLAIAVLTLVVLYIRFTVSFFTGCDPEQTVESQENYCASGPGQGPGKKQSFKSPHRSELIHGFVTSITLLVVAIPEGLPLAVTITMAYSVQKMLADMNLVRYLGACETMGSATTICSDKTGTLTTNRMTVMKSWMGGTLYDTMPDASAVKTKLLQTVFNSIGLNSTGRLDATNPKPGMPVMHIGNKTECAMLAFVNALGGDYEAVRSALTAEQNTEKEIHTFSSARKRMSTLVPNEKGGFRLYCKGAAEIVLELCTSMLNGEGEPMPFSQQDRDNARNKVIKYFAEDGLRCIALAIRDFDKKPELVNDWLDLEKNLSLVLLVGIEDPVRDEVPHAIELCRKAGIMVRMVTGDNIETARSIARKCGILPPTGQAHQYEVMEGPTFRQMCVEANGDVKQDEIDKVWPHLRVLARSSPTDKYSLVTGIKKSTIGDLQIVAVTGDGTNDGPALKQADVGFAMGITGTAIAQEASDIILMDDNFNSIVKAVKWGRNVYDNVGKFLQFQLTVNVVAVVVCFITSAVTASSILSTVQMLWVNLIMDSLAALALATEMPTDNLLDRKPYPRNRALLSRLQLRFIFGHAALQLAVIFILVYYLEPHQCEEPDQWIGTNGLFYTHDCIEPTHEHGQKAMPTELWHSHCPQRAGFNHSDPEDKPLACPWHKNTWWVTPQAKRDKCYEMCMNPHDNLEESGHGDAQDDIRFKTLVFNTFVMMQAANEINARKLNGELNVFDK
jgi:Ca2+ transporting ATPase